MLKYFFLILFLLPSQIAKAVSPAPVQGKQCMVVSAQRYASQVGYDILEKQNGNAIDAAVAMGYALAVVLPCCGNIGGGGFMLIRFANGQATFLNFREKAPIKTEIGHFLDEKGNVITGNLSTGHIKGTLDRPYLAVGIPGTVMGLNLALKKYGTLPLKKVMAPAIRLAEEGFTLVPGDIAILKTGEESFKTQPNVSAIFLKNGRSYQPGEKLIQKDLSETLKAIAEKGTPVFYQGWIADEIVKASRAKGGTIAKEDFKTYTVEENLPLKCTYRNYGIITAPPPGSGLTICETLKIIEPYSLSSYGFHASKSTHYTLEAMRYAYRDRNLKLGDPNFVKNPINKILSPIYIQKLRNRIKPNKATPSDSIKFIPNPESHETTSYVVVDKYGNAVSVTYTLNDFFGAKVIAGRTGFFLNNEMADFTIKPDTPNIYGLYQGKQNRVEGKKRPLSSMSPTLLTQNNQLYLVVSTPGGSTIPSQLINVITNIIDYGMNIQEAIDAPRFHMQWMPDLVYMEPFAFSNDTKAIMEKMGYRFKAGSPYDTPFWGAVTGIMRDPKLHKLYGAMDNRRQNGAAIGN